MFFVITSELIYYKRKETRVFSNAVRDFVSIYYKSLRKSWDLRLNFLEWKTVAGERFKWEYTYFAVSLHVLKQEQQRLIEFY